MTMLKQVLRLSSSSALFAEECDNLKAIFLKLKYPERLINFSITTIVWILVLEKKVCFLHFSDAFQAFCSQVGDHMQ